jgi:hypothetical protein
MTAAPNPIERFSLPRGDGQGDYVVYLSRPEGEAKDVPVIFVLDADMTFSLAVEVANLRAIGGAFPRPVLAGIGYGANFAEMAKLRTGDLTPPTSADGAAALGNMTSLIGDKSGGADALLAFIVDSLAPEINRRCPEASKTRRILYGHSLAGLFAAYALLTRPDAFEAFLASSPSLWWDGFAVLKHLPAFTEHRKKLAQLPRVMVAVGGMEQDVPTEVPPSLNMDLAQVQAIVTMARMVDGAAEFAVALRDAGLTSVHHVCFTDEDHASVIPPSFNRGLTVALKP